MLKFINATAIQIISATAIIYKVRVSSKYMLQWNHKKKQSNSPWDDIIRVLQANFRASKSERWSGEVERACWTSFNEKKDASGGWFAKDRCLGTWEKKTQT